MYGCGGVDYTNALRCTRNAATMLVRTLVSRWEGPHERKSARAYFFLLYLFLFLFLFLIAVLSSVKILLYTCIKRLGMCNESDESIWNSRRASFGFITSTIKEKERRRVSWSLHLAVAAFFCFSHRGKGAKDEISKQRTEITPAMFSHPRGEKSQSAKGSLVFYIITRAYLTSPG